MFVSLRVMAPLNNASARDSMKRGSIGAGNHPASGGPTSSGGARARIGVGNHRGVDGVLAQLVALGPALGQETTYWGRLTPIGAG